MKKREDKKVEMEKERWRGSEGRGQEDRGECLRCPDLTHSAGLKVAWFCCSPFLLHRMKIVRTPRIARHCFLIGFGDSSCWLILGRRD